MEGRAVLWTMPVEVAFYLLLAPLIMAMTYFAAVDRRLVAVAAVLAFAWLCYVYSFDKTGWIATWGVHSYAPYFVFGVIASAVMVSFRDVISAIPNYWLNFVGVTALGFFLIQNPYWWQSLYLPADWSYDPNNVGSLSFDVYLKWRTYAMVPIVAVLFMATEAGASILQRLFSLHILTFLGRYSYGIYLLHWPILINVKTYVSNPASGFFIAAAIAVGLGFILYWWVEKPGIGLGAQIAAKIVPRKSRNRDGP